MSNNIQTTGRKQEEWRQLWRQFARRPVSLIGLALILLLIGTAAGADILAPMDPYGVNLDDRLAAPANGHPLGQDGLGRDVLSRLIYGARVSILVGVVSVLASAIIGTTIGVVAGYRGGWVDEVLMRILDVFLAFPGLLLAIAVMAILGPSLQNVIIALTLSGWKVYARVARGQVLVEREKEYVVASRALGVHPLFVMARHILPNISAPLIVTMTLGMAGMIMQEAGLSFLGLGAQPPTASWGSMLADGHTYILTAWHLTVFPGLAIMATVLGFNFLGEGMRDALDPRLRPM